MAAGVIIGCGEKPVAVVNGQRITEAEFIARLKETAGPQVLNSMIARQLVEQAFADSDLEVSTEEVDRRLAESQRGFPTPEQFAQALESRGISMAELRQNIELGLKAEMLRSENVKVTEEALETFFKEYPELFDKPLRVVISEIVVSSKETAQEVAKELKRSDADFAALAIQYSLGPTRERGGRRPETPMNYLIPQELREPAQTVKVGEVSGAIAADERWYIIKIEERKAPEPAVFEKIREQVVEHYKRSKWEPEEQLIRRLQETAVVSIVAPEFEHLNRLYQPAAELPEFGPQQPNPPSEEAGAATTQ